MRAIAKEYGGSWELGDIIGCALDFDTGTISFSRNGVGLGVAFTVNRAKLQAAAFFPAATLNNGVWQFLFAAGEVVYAPRDAHLFSRTVHPGREVTLHLDGCGQLKVDRQLDDTLLLMHMTRAIDVMRPTCINTPVAECGRCFTIYSARVIMAWASHLIFASQHLSAVLWSRQCWSGFVGVAGVGGCSGWGPDDEGLLVLWIMLGAAGGLGLLTLSAMVHGERLRRRRQFRLVRGACSRAPTRCVANYPRSSLVIL